MRSSVKLLIACIIQVFLVVFLYRFAFFVYGEPVYVECVMAISVTHSMIGLLLNTVIAAIKKGKLAKFLMTGIAVIVSCIFVAHTGIVITISYELSMLLPLLLNLNIDISS